MARCNSALTDLICYVAHNSRNLRLTYDVAGCVIQLWLSLFVMLCAVGEVGVHVAGCVIQPWLSLFVMLCAVREAGFHVAGAAEAGRQLQLAPRAERAARGGGRHAATRRQHHGLPQRVLRSHPATGAVCCCCCCCNMFACLKLQTL